MTPTGKSPLIHHTPEAIHAETQQRLHLAGKQSLVAASTAMQLLPLPAARPGRIRRAARAIRRAAAESLRPHPTRK
ncbi:hypothetical protein [Streptomyces roseolus]|uniref:hypothetical protein n=1 Tax=Streptomyces roseolus TaxID=67358 RepID=UPI00378A5807